MESRRAMKLRASIGIGEIVAFLAALTLASSPRLHEKLHPTSTPHECAATMIASGNCEHSVPPPVAPKPFQAPFSSALFLHGVALVPAASRSSILEHAPPPAH